MKVLITGGNKGLGQEIKNAFDAVSVSRGNGYDITKENDRARIAQMSLDYDVFINNAFDGPFQESWADFAQVHLLFAVASIWQEKNKQGWIINIGSTGSENVVAPVPAFETYRVSKEALKHHSLQWSQAFKENKVAFRTSILVLDRLDTELTRSRASWTGNGIDCQDIVSSINLILSLKPNTCMREISAWVNLDFADKT